MPVTIGRRIRRLSQEEFGAIAYRAMGVVYGAHRELGRLFDELIYKQALKASLDEVDLEVPIYVTWRDFSKTYFLDVLIAGGAPIEFKAVEALTGRHRAQLLNYMLLMELAHGKLVNLRGAYVEDEFVNSNLIRNDRVDFQVDESRFVACCPEAHLFREAIIDILRDWGTGLELSLYREVITHFFGGELIVMQDVDAFWQGLAIARQPMQLIAPMVSFAFTALEESLSSYEAHALRLLNHTSLKAIVWANIARHRLTLITLS